MRKVTIQVSGKNEKEVIEAISSAATRLLSEMGYEESCVLVENIPKKELKPIIFGKEVMGCESV